VARYSLTKGRPALQWWQIQPGKKIVPRCLPATCVEPSCVGLPSSLGKTRDVDSLHLFLFYVGNLVNGYPKEEKQALN